MPYITISPTPRAEVVTRPLPVIVSFAGELVDGLSDAVASDQPFTKSDLLERLAVIRSVLGEAEDILGGGSDGSDSVAECAVCRDTVVFDLDGNVIGGVLDL